MIADRPIAEQIEILKVSNQLHPTQWLSTFSDVAQIIELQLSAREKLGLNFASTSPIAYRPSRCNLQSAIQKAVSTATTEDWSELRNEMQAVSAKLTELEKKQKDILEFKKACERLTKAMETAQKHLEGGKVSTLTRKRGSAFVEIGDFSEEAVAAVDVYKRIKTQVRTTRHGFSRLDGSGISLEDFVL